MATQVFSPIEIFHDVNGQPLDDGFIWIGVANLDPETNPISVFFDDALTIPATQPIRTRNGYPSNAGAQARLYVTATTYSIKVKNKNSSQITSITALDSLRNDLANSSDPAKGAGMVGWTRSPTAHTAHDVANFLNAQAVNLWEFASLVTNKPNPSDPESWDWKPAFDALYEYIESNYPQANLRYGKAAYIPAGRYLVSGMVGPKRLGITTIGDGPLTSVIEAMSGFVGSWVFQARHEASGNMGGASLLEFGVDCAGLSVGGINMVDAYDGVLVDNVRVSRVHGANYGFQMNPEFQPVCQTVSLRNLFVYKVDNTSTVPPVRFVKCQEIQLIGCKSWAGGFGIAGRGNVTAYLFEDCRSVDMLGCSSAGAENHGVTVSAVTKQISGIRIRGHLYENCTGRLRTSTTDFVNFKILTLYHDLPRLESPAAGGFTLDGLSGGILDIGVSTATLSANTEQTSVYAQRLVNVTDSGTRNVITSYPNGIDNFAGVSTQFRVSMPSTPRMALGRPDTADVTFWDWNSNSGSDLGARLGFVKGSITTTCAIFNEAPASTQSSMQLLINDGATTTVRRVTVGAADSGGAGFRLLRVPNT